MITKKQKLAVFYFLSRSMFLGMGFAQIFGKSSKDSWISIILGSLIGFLIVSMISYILKVKKNMTLKEYLSSIKYMGIILRINLLLFSTFIIYHCINITQTLATSFFLFNTPPLLICIPGIVLAALAVKDDSTLYKVAEGIILIVLFLYISTLIILSSYMEIDAFLPVYTVTNKNILLGSLFYGLFSSAPLIFLLDDIDDGKYYKISYIICSLTLLITTIIITGVLGEALISIYRFPEYMVLKRIKIFSFIEKIENILSVLWIIDAFILLCKSTLLTKHLLPSKNNNIYFYGLLIIITLITGIVFGSNYIIDLNVFLRAPYILLGAIAFIVIPLFIYSFLTQKKKSITIS